MRQCEGIAKLRSVEFMAFPEDTSKMYNLEYGNRCPMGNLIQLGSRKQGHTIPQFN